MTDRRLLPDDLIDAHLNGGLAADGRLGFERMLEEHPNLRPELARQERIHKTLRRLFAPPPDSRLHAIADAALVAAPAPATPATAPRRRLAAAAALLGIIAGSWLIWTALGIRVRGPGYVTLPRTSLDDVYDAQVAGGLGPEWRCETDEEFSEAFADRLGQPLVLDALPAGTEALGLSYCNCFTPRTMYLLARSDGRAVIVFVDRVERDTAPSAPDGLNLFRSRVGPLVLYELSPLETPAVLPFLREPRTDQLKEKRP